MKVICLIIAGTVDECMVVNDDQEQEIIDKLADANDKLEKDERIHIHSLAPTPVENLDALIDYISTP
jgi:hypothetical protein